MDALAMLSKLRRLPDKHPRPTAPDRCVQTVLAEHVVRAKYDTQGMVMVPIQCGDLTDLNLQVSSMTLTWQLRYTWPPSS
jgi:hypothetical protein